MVEMLHIDEQQNPVPTALLAVFPNRGVGGHVAPSCQRGTSSSATTGGSPAPTTL